MPVTGVSTKLPPISLSRRPYPFIVRQIRVRKCYSGFPVGLEFGTISRGPSVFGFLAGLAVGRNKYISFLGALCGCLFSAWKIDLYVPSVPSFRPPAHSAEGALVHGSQFHEPNLI